MKLVDSNEVREDVKNTLLHKIVQNFLLEHSPKDNQQNTTGLQ
jgi:hypothetical protein